MSLHPVLAVAFLLLGIVFAGFAARWVTDWTVGARKHADLASRREEEK